MKDNISVDSASKQFWASVSAYPNAIAIHDYKPISYTELAATASQIAWHILANTETKDAPFTQSSNGIVALMIEHGAPLITAITGVTLSGYAYQPIDLSTPTARICLTLEHAKPTVIIASRTQFEQAKTVAPTNCRVFLYDEITTGMHDRGPCYIDRSEHDTAYVLSTSGSTGTPKLIAHSERNMLRAVQHYRSDLHPQTEDNIALILPCTYTPSVFCIFGALFSGASICPFDLKTKSVADMAEWLAEANISLLYTSPTIFRRLLNDVQADALFSSLRSVQLAGEPLFKSDVERVQARFADSFQLYNGMGTTETSCLTRYVVDSSTPLADSRVPIGKAYDDVTVEILDDDGTPVGCGEEGELVVSSEYFATGYLNDPKRSKAAFSAHPQKGENANSRIVYRTGDRACLTKSGNIVHLGRLDDQIKLRGQRIELEEIEATMVRSNVASQAVATLISPEDGQPFIAAFFQPEGNVGDIRSYLCSHLPPQMIPTRIVSMVKLPVNNSGKIDRRLLKEYAFGERQAQTDQEPENVLEQRITEHFQTVLKNPSLGVQSNFFDHGGDSLRAVELAITIQEQVATPLNVSCLIEAPTPRELAKLVHEQMRTRQIKYLIQFHDERDHEQRATNAIPIFCLPGIAGDALSYRPLASKMLKSRAVYAMEYPGYNGDEINFSSVQDLVQICFDAISSVYPKGDIALVCYSMGGVFGYELTRKFHSAGRKVVNLVLIDCYTPLHLKIDHSIRYLRGVVNRLKRKMTKHDDNVQKKSLVKDIQKRVDSTLINAVRRYSAKPQKIDNMMLIKALDKNKPKRLVDYYSQWYSLNRAKVTTVEVKGGHLEVMVPPKVEEISDIINAAIGGETHASRPPKNPEGHRNAMLDRLKDTWNFAGSLFPEMENVEPGLKHTHKDLLSTSAQLTSRLVNHLSEGIEPKILTSAQRGQFYCRKVALRTQQSNRVAAVAAIRVSMDKLPKYAAEDIVRGNHAFGDILSKYDIKYQCGNTVLFQAKTNASLLQDFLIRDSAELLHGRTNQFYAPDGEVIADVIEILAPWV